MDTILKNIIKNKQTCIFVSPHLDDAMLSAGGLIHYLSKKTKVVVINVFTESSDEKQTLSAWKFIKDMGYEKPSALFKERLAEDKKAFESMGIEPIYLGFSDALWRKKNGFVAKSLGAIISEFAHVYPTYRFHMMSGKVAKADNITKTDVTKRIKKIIEHEKSPLVFSPLGVGGHPDHILVRDVCASSFSENLIYWSDFPYNHREKNDGTPPNGYEKHVFSVDMKVKQELINQYKTQVSGLFPGSIIPDHQEIFFTK